MHRSIAVYSILILAAALAAGQEEPPPRLEWQFGAQAFRYDNFFQAPDGAPEQDVDATRAEGRLAYRLRPEGPFVFYASADFTAYEDDLDDSLSFGLGLESDSRPREWILGVEHNRDQPVFDVGDEFDRANVLRLAGEYGYRVTEDWQVSALAELRQEEFDQTTGKDNDFVSGGAALRYRGWGYDFSPELGVELGERSADDPNEDHDQRDVWLKIRSIPFEDLYLSLRFRVRGVHRG